MLSEVGGATAREIVGNTIKERAKSSGPGFNAKYLFYDVVDQRKAQKYHDELLDYWKKNKPEGAKIIDDTPPSGRGGEMRPDTGSIYIYPMYVTNEVLMDSHLGLRTEELLHFKQAHERGVIGKTWEEAYGGRSVKEHQALLDVMYESQVDPLLRLNGFGGTD